MKPISKTMGMTQPKVYEKQFDDSRKWADCQNLRSGSSGKILNSFVFRQSSEPTNQILSNQITLNLARENADS